MTGPRVVFASADVVAEYNDLLLVDTTDGDITVTLPAASWGLPPVSVKKNSADANNVIVARSGTALLDGATSVTLSNVHESVTLVPNGTDWSATAGVAGTAPVPAVDIVALGDHALWRSSSITGLVDGDPISTVPDDSGLSHAATASGALRPTYKTGILNGHPAMRFTGTEGLTATADAGHLPISVFVVLIRTSGISGECCIRGAAATGGVEFRHTAGGALHLVMPNVADIATSTSNPFDTLTGINVPKIVGFTYDGSTYAFYDGTTQIGTGSSSHSGSASNTNLGYDTVGGSDLFIIADVFDHLEAASILTSDQIADLVAAWQTKFAI